MNEHTSVCLIALWRRTCNCKSWNTFFQILLSCSVIIDWAKWFAKSLLPMVAASSTQCDQRARLFGLLDQWKFAKNYLKNCQSCSNFCQILKRPFQNCPRLLEFGQSGEFSPNLVTLDCALFWLLGYLWKESPFLFCFKEAANSYQETWVWFWNRF